MEICVINIGKISSDWINKGVQQFENRIPHYIKYNSIIIPDVKTSKSLSKETQKQEEGKQILNMLLTSDFVVILDEKGKENTSREFAEWIQRQMVSGRKRVVFIIGGPYGFSEQIYNRADLKISLSKLTFTHEMAKLIFTEQVYRAMTILKGEPYHHD